MTFLSGLRRFLIVFSHGFSPLMAIVITEVVNVEMSAFTPFGHGEKINFVWPLLQGAVGWLFGWFSDKHWRKNVLIGAQLLGVFGGLSLIIFGFKPFVMVLVGLTFAPLPVARAALMDAYPSQSMVRLMAVTFFAQWLPWSFYGILTKADYVTVMYVVLAALLINSLLSAWMFKEDTQHIKLQAEKRKELPGLMNLNSWKPILFTLLALGFAESTFFLVTDRLEAHTSIRQLWWPFIGFMTFLGNCIAMFYRSRPSVSFLSICFLAGTFFCGVALLSVLLGIQAPDSALGTAIIPYSLIGGLYLPLSYAVVLNSVSPLHKGSACGALDMVELVAAIAAAGILQPMDLGGMQILLVFAVIYLIAFSLQKYAGYINSQRPS